MSETLQTVIDILQELHEDIDFETRTDLIDGKVLDSFDIVTLTAELNSEFDITITADKLVPENFNSAKAIAALVEELADE